jgi:signal transduction histidine kinase
MRRYKVVRLTLIIAFLILTIIPLSFITYLSYKRTRKAMYESITVNFLQITMDKASSIQHWLFERKTDVQVISETPWIVEAIENPEQSAKFSAFLEIVLKNYGFYDELFIIDKEGNYCIGTGDSQSKKKDMDRKNRDYFYKTISGNPVMTDIRISETLKEPTMFFSYPIRKNDNEIVGVLVARIKLDLIKKVMSEIETGETVESYLLNKEGYFLTESKFEKNAILNIRVNTEGFKACRRYHKGVGEYLDYRGKPVLGSYLYLEDRDWCLLVEQDVSEVFREISVLRRATISLTVLIVILVSLFSLIVSQIVVNSLKRRDREIEKHARERLKTEKLISAGQLAAGIAHEIGNPLAGIINCAKLIQTGLDKTDEKTLKYLHSIQREAERCNKTIKNFLSFARETEMIFENVEVNAILKESLDLVAHQAASQHVHIKKTLNDLRPMYGDKVQLKQAFTNMYLNSLAAMVGGGDLIIETQQVGDYIEISIRDTGIGIDEKDLSMIFEPFFTTKREGTGLGLAMVYKVIDKHDGRIEVHSSKGKGTEFNIRFPIWKKGKG